MTSSEKLQVVSYRLRIRNGEQDACLDLLPGNHRLGNGSGSDLRLDRVGVSRRHALLRVEPGKVVAIDLNSKNGVFLNGRRIRRAEVGIDDVLAFGPVETCLEAVDPGDGRLAIEFSLDPGEGDVASSTTATALEPQHQKGWMEVVRRFAQALAGSSLGSALAMLRKELKAETVCVFERDRSGRPSIRAATGPTDADALAWAASAGRADDEEEHRLSRPGAAACVQGTCGLLVLGASPRPAFDQGLASLLQISRLRATSQERGSERESSHSLVFPKGFVPGISPAMIDLYEQLRPLARGDLPVLLVGETGVGKEGLARAVHLSSPRASGPLVAINCAAIPTELLEAELFGIGNKVATGVAQRVGRFGRAQGGTLFLDEVGEMPASLQVKLLRALQEKRIEPIGAASIPIDVRVVAATNVDIYGQMETGSFRRDLFYRLAGCVLEIPPLRRRVEDIPGLVECFVRRFARDAERGVRGVTARALEALVRFEWPGNVRELEHEIRRLVYLCPEGGTIDWPLLAERLRRPSEPREDTEPTGPTDAPNPMPGADSLPTLNLDRLERSALIQAMQEGGGRRGEASRLLGITRHALRRRLQRHGLDDKPQRGLNGSRGSLHSPHRH